jgi:hypothetical protein
MNDFSETQTPNGGWQWYQPQTKFRIDRNSKPSSVSVTLDQVAEIVQKHRLQNPQFDLPTVFLQVRQEILNYNRQRLGMPPADNPPKSLPQQPKHAAAVAGHVGKTAAGIRLVVDWLGSGLRPVPRAEAEARAIICATCPQNQTGDLWQRLDAKAADGLKRLISIKSEMALMTSQDSNLKTCVACDCHLQLKVHTPMKHILENTGSEVMEKLDRRCWILHA